MPPVPLLCRVLLISVLPATAIAAGHPAPAAAQVTPVQAVPAQVAPTQAAPESSAVEPGARAASVTGHAFEDRNGNGVRDAGETGIAGVKLSNGRVLVRTAADGGYVLPVQPGDTVFAIKPATYRIGAGGNGLPLFWRHHFPEGSPALAFGGVPVASTSRFDVALQREVSPRGELEVVVLADPQVASRVDVDYYARDIVDSIRTSFAGRAPARLGLSLGDIVNDDLSLYPQLNAHTAALGVPWLHVAGNHDLDFDAARDEDSLLSFRHTFGPDTFAWEEPGASFVLLDDVIYRPGQRPAYIGGLREEQFAFLEAYLPTVDKGGLLVVGAHIPFFDTANAPGRESFRSADRERLFALLQAFPNVLLLSGHGHVQQHVQHGAASGWHGAAPLHEYNVGAACGAFWSGTKDEQGIPDATMSDGTPNGFSTLRVRPGGQYALAWHPARLTSDHPGVTAAMALHAPKVLRRGAYPAWGVYANVFMGRDHSRVEYRVGDGPWQPMRRVEQPDPRLLAENVRDDQAEILRGYDRSPEAVASTHLWRGALPTDLAVGSHRVEVRVFDDGAGAHRAHIDYRLQEANP